MPLLLISITSICNLFVMYFRLQFYINLYIIYYVYTYICININNLCIFVFFCYLLNAVGASFVCVSLACQSLKPCNHIYHKCILFQRVYLQCVALRFLTVQRQNHIPHMDIEHLCELQLYAVLKISFEKQYIHILHTDIDLLRGHLLCGALT